MSGRASWPRACLLLLVVAVVRSVTIGGWRRASFTGIGAVWPGGTCRRSLVRGSRFGSAIGATVATEPGTGYWPLLSVADAVEKWTGRFRLTPRLAAAYSSRAIRTHLRDHGITAVIPSQSTKIGHRKRRGSAGGRRPTFDKEDYKGRNVVERKLQHLQAVPRPGNALRQTRTHLPRRSRTPRSSHPADGFRGHTQAPLCMPASRLTVSLWLVEMMEMRQRRPS